MGNLTRIGMDTSKSVFQLHGVDDGEQPVLRRKLRRQDLNKFFGGLPGLRIGMEACGASHHWARELQALGHEVVLIPPQYTKPYVDRGKNDAADAEAIWVLVIARAHRLRACTIPGAGLTRRRELLRDG